jgi:hypothetical protein
MPVGLPLKTTYANGDVFSASDINDTNGTVNLVGQTNNFYAGKNAIINGDFRISQRGTTFTNPANAAYNLDRFSVVYDGTITSHTVSQQTFTPGTAPVAGYEGANFARWAITTNGTSTYRLFVQRIEDVRKYAGQTVTFSFWIKADSARTLTNATYGQNFGSGGSGTVESTFTLSTNSLTTSWQRITGTATFPSISGKTIGTGSNVFIYLSFPTAGTFDTWGWQLEAGSTATAFQTATGTIQGELAACQRYYYRAGGSGVATLYGSGAAYSTTKGFGAVNLPVTMRVAPTSLDFSTLCFHRDASQSRIAITSAILLSDYNQQNIALVEGTVASGLTAGTVYMLTNNASSSGFIGFSAEL